MDFLEKIEASLPSGITFAYLKSFCPQGCWDINPVQASMIALEASGAFDKIDYLRRYPDVFASKMDPLYHFLNYGIHEKRIFKKAKLRYKLFDVSVADRCLIPAKALTYSVIIKTSMNSSDITSQYRALMAQTRKPAELIYLRREDSPSQKTIRSATSQDVKILDMDPDSPADLLYAAQLASGEYLAVIENGIIPGKFWVANAMRASSGYGALVAAAGFLVTSHSGRRAFLSVSPGEDTDGNLSCATRDVFCDWGGLSLVLRREWLVKLNFDNFCNTRGSLAEQLAYALCIELG